MENIAENIAEIREAISVGDWVRGYDHIETEADDEYFASHVAHVWNLEERELEDFDFETAAQLTVIGYHEAGKVTEIVEFLRNDSRLKTSGFYPRHLRYDTPVEFDDRSEYGSEEALPNFCYHTAYSTTQEDMADSYSYEEPQDFPLMEEEHTTLLSKLWGVFDGSIPECIWDEDRLDIQVLCQDVYDFLAEEKKIRELEKKIEEHSGVCHDCGVSGVRVLTSGGEIEIDGDMIYLSSEENVFLLPGDGEFGSEDALFCDACWDKRTDI